MVKILSKKPIAAITGGRGFVGSSIAINLIKRGWRIKLLSRSDSLSGSKLQKFRKDIDIVNSDICSVDSLLDLVDGVDAIFHCAGEVHDEQRMYSTNIEGTKNILAAAKKSGASFFCYISSAGVVGVSSHIIIDEKTECSPYNKYEKSKYKAESLVKIANLDMSVCILRPTNIVSKENIGALSLAISNKWYDKIKVFIKGRELTHLVHVEDVANAAIYFMSNSLPGIHTYLVSIDGCENNTLSEVYYLCCSRYRPGDKILYVMPLFVPYFLRRIFRGKSLYGNTLFSNKKITEAGFLFKYDVVDIVNDVCRCKGNLT